MANTEPQPGQPMQVQKLHAGYVLRRWPHRSLTVTAQDLLDIMEYALLHAEQLRQEAKQAKELDRKSKEGQ